MEAPKEIMVNWSPARVLEAKQSGSDTLIVLCDISDQNTYTPFAVWRAYVSPRSGEWAVGSGNYACTLLEAVDYFKERV